MDLVGLLVMAMESFNTSNHIIMVSTEHLTSPTAIIVTSITIALMGYGQAVAISITSSQRSMEDMGSIQGPATKSAIA